MELYLSNPKRPHGMKFSYEEGKHSFFNYHHSPHHMNGSIFTDHSKFEL